MSTESTQVASPMRGPEAWRRTLDIGERYLAVGDPDLLPPPDCGVRCDILRISRPAAPQPPVIQESA